MAEEPPGVQDFSDDLVEELADEVVGGTTRDQMLGTMSGISGRLENSWLLHHCGGIEPQADIGGSHALLLKPAVMSTQLLAHWAVAEGLGIRDAV